MSEFKREKRYTVLKETDIIYLSKEQQKHLRDILFSINIIRANRDKNELRCVVIEHDWPEYEYVWGLIQHRMEIFGQ